MNHKPMLACDCGDLSGLPFPLLASPKLDGVRAIVTAGGLMSRSLKRIPNVNVQAMFEGLPIGLDGEIIVGDPCAPDAYRKTVSVVMSDDASIDGLVFHVFDIQDSLSVADGARFSERSQYLTDYFCGLQNDALTRVEHRSITDATELLAYEAECVGLGYEGLMLRCGDAPYKHGRSTRREGYLLKLKRFSDSEAEVVGVTELMHNGNEAKTNALGRTERSSHKAGKVGMGVLGALVVRDVKTGVEFEIGTGFTAEDRALLWSHALNGQKFALAKYKYFAGGSKDRPRFPVFLGWRDKRDV